MGAAGGCLPLLVLKGPPEKTLPYTRWLDWCSIAYIISDTTARSGMASVLQKLEKVTAQEAAAKRAALLAVRDAFVWRSPDADPLARPSAAGAEVARRTRKHVPSGACVRAHNARVAQIASHSCFSSQGDLVLRLPLGRTL